MVHGYPLSIVTEFAHPALRHVARRTIASHEHELTERRGTETRLRAAPSREEALLRPKDELLHHREILDREADHRLMNGLPSRLTMRALVEQIGGTLQVGPCAQCQGTRFAVAFT